MPGRARGRGAPRPRSGLNKWAGRLNTAGQRAYASAARKARRRNSSAVLNASSNPNEVWAGMQYAAEQGVSFTNAETRAVLQGVGFTEAGA